MKLSSRRTAAVMVLSLIFLLAITGGALAAPPWSDAADAWWVSSYGVTSAQVATVADGYPDGTFKPSNPVTRGQFAKMAVNGLDLDTADPASATFTDVAKGSTYYIYVEGAHAANLIGGYPGTPGPSYRPNNNISRQQTNSILGRYLSQAELNATGVIHGTGGLTYASLALWYAAEGSFYLNGFLDASQVANEHKAATAYLVFHEVVEGSGGRLSPTATLNRAQAAVMVLRVAGEAADITTPPPAPTGLEVIPASPGTDTTPRVTGHAIPSSPIAVYDTLGGVTTKLIETSTNPQGEFNVDLTDKITPLADGTHSFTAKVKNALGLVSAASAPVTYILDTVAPTGEITAPVVPEGQVDAAVKSAKPVFTATAADERSGVDDVEFQYSVDQATPNWTTISTDEAPETGTSLYAVSWPVQGELAAGLADGQYLFRAIINDNAGNHRIVGPTEVTIDTTPPQAHIAPGSLVPLIGGVFYADDGEPAFGATASDASGDGVGTLPSGVTMVEFLYAPMTPQPDAWNDFTVISADLGSSGFADYSHGAIHDGDWLFAVRATDRAGNQSLLVSGNPPSFVDGVAQEVVIGPPLPVTNIVGSDPDNTQSGLDWHDFHATWTVSASLHVASQRVYLLPTDQTLNLAIDTPVATFMNNSTAVWDSTNALVADSRNAALATVAYRIWVVATDPAGRTTPSSSAPFTPVSEP